MQSSKPRLRARKHNRLLAWSLVIAALLLPAGTAWGQTCTMPVTVVPVSPNTTTPVTLTFTGFHRSCSTLVHGVSGNIISIQHEWECLIQESFEPREVVVGILPPGTYEVRFVSTLGDPETAFVTCGSFTVTASASTATVPTLSEPVLIGLVIVLSFLGMVVVGRVR